MYKEKSQDWMKHLDFIVIDLLVLLLAFVLAYLTRYDIHMRNKDIYVSLALILLLLVMAGCAFRRNLSTSHTYTTPPYDDAETYV